MFTEKRAKEEYYKRAGKVKTAKDFEKLVNFISKQKQDHGTIVYACAACAKAGFNVVNISENGGITEFQASCVGWEMIEEFFGKGGLRRLVNYDDMLYPQYGHEFEKVLDKNVFEKLQETAKKNLKNRKNVHPDVIVHWKSIVSGKVPFGYKLED